MKYLILAFILFLFSSNQEVFASSWDNNLLEAQKSYKEGNYSKAFEHYKQAQIDNPQDNQLKYNLGNSAYKSGKYTDAEKTFKSLANSDINNNLKAKSLYNLGNTLI
ncbi:MAG: tetratricopeptide repeat protein [Candidatus Sericytochromatia bacterium]